MVRGALCSFGGGIKTQTFNIYNINEVITQTPKYLFYPHIIKQAILRGKYGPQPIERWQGPPNINKVTQDEIEWSFKV